MEAPKFRKGIWSERKDYHKDAEWLKNVKKRLEQDKDQDHFFFYIYNLHVFKQKVYSRQVLIYLDVPGIPVKKPLQNS